jgi:hypothetical protein
MVFSKILTLHLVLFLWKVKKNEMREYVVRITK